MADAITVTEASQILGVSPKRVRQLIAERRLNKVGESPVKVSQKEVLSLHASRQNNPTATRSSVPKKDPTLAIVEVIQEMQADHWAVIREMQDEHSAQVAELVAGIKAEAQKQLLSAEMNQNNLIAEINRLKAENEALSKKRRFLGR
jgi:hypothetical protein